MNSLNHIQWRCYLTGQLKVESPLIIGSSENDVADVQCIRDGNGHFFIPGTTLAGKIRNWILESPEAPAFFKDVAFGENKDNGYQSLLIFSDALSCSNEVSASTVRDSVRLDRITKTAVDMGKFDYETIDCGQSFQFKLEAILRENNSDLKDSMMELVRGIASVLSKGLVRLGAKTNRGMGKVVLKDPRWAVFDFCEDLNRKVEGERWLAWRLNGCNTEYVPIPYITEIPASCSGPDSYIIEAGFSLPGALLIRSYSTDPAAPDVVPFSSIDISAGPKGKLLPTIPGTSWAGALSHGLYDLGRALGKEQKMEKLLKGLFGHVEVVKVQQQKSTSSTNEERAFASNILFEESFVKESHSIDYTRNKIDRFTGGVVDSALFTERLCVGKKVNLKCKIRKDFYKVCAVSEEDRPSPEACVGALLLGFLDLANGIQNVGGTGSVGRGVFHGTTLKLNGQDILKAINGYALLNNDAVGDFVKSMTDYLKEDHHV